MPHAKPPETENASAALLKQFDKGVRHHVAPLAAIDHPAFCALSTEAGSAARVYEALTRLRQRFVDWNEMRVARAAEVARAIGHYPDGPPEGHKWGAHDFQYFRNRNG